MINLTQEFRGLGKTIQCICFLSFLYHEQNIPGPYMVIVPLSTITAWLREFKKWAPDMYVVSYIGDGKSRETIRQHELFFDDENDGKRFKFNVIVTTYEIILKDGIKQN